MFLLWRQDDNGNRFIVGSFADRTAAERQMAELTRALHKQTYWIEDERAGIAINAGKTPE
jgi:hypothetical protein